MIEREDIPELRDRDRKKRRSGWTPDGPPPAHPNCRCEPEKIRSADQLRIVLLESHLSKLEGDLAKARFGPWEKARLFALGIALGGILASLLA